MRVVGVGVVGVGVVRLVVTGAVVGWGARFVVFGVCGARVAVVVEEVEVVVRRLHHQLHPERLHPMLLHLRHQ